MNTYIKIMAAMVFAATYSSSMAADCYSCAIGSTVCEGAGTGKCDWEGGLLCTGMGTCTATWPMQKPVPQCNEDDDGNMTNCTVGPSEAVMVSGCKIKCSIKPFLSCDCVTTGEFGGVPSGFHAPYLECKKQ